MSNNIDEKAVAYWQDRLGKFFPTAKGPSGVEIDMYRAGYAAGSAENSHLRAALKKIADTTWPIEVSERTDWDELNESGLIEWMMTIAEAALNPKERKNND